MKKTKKQLTIIATIALMLVLLLSGCEQSDMPPQDITDAVTDTASIPEPDAVLVKDGSSAYSICISESASDAVKAAAEELSAAILGSTDVSLPVTNGDADSAIYITTDYSVELGEYGYAITVSDGDVYINAACEDSLMYALAIFDNTFIAPSDGELTLSVDADITVKRDEKLILADYIDLGLEVETELSTVGLYDGVTVDSKEYYISQGAATDGEYIYVVLKHSEYLGVVVKLDFNGSTIAISEPHDFGHANDMTFDTDKNLIVLVHGTSYENTKNGNGNGRRFSLLDPDTLDLVYTTETGFDIGKEAGAISYNTETGVYTIGRLCTYYHQFKMNDDYSLTYSFSTTRGTAEEEGRVGYTGQGLGGDNRYVYFPYSGTQKGIPSNLLVVYDNFGKYVTTISIDSPMESESLFFTEGRYYICFNWGDAYIHELLYKPVYRAAAEANT